MLIGWLFDYYHYFLIFLGGLFLLYRFQRNLLYYPNDSPRIPTPDCSTEFKLPTADGFLLEAHWASPPQGHWAWQTRGPRLPTLLFFCGNAGNPSHRFPNVELIVDRVGVNVILIGYRGYGRSGGKPSQQALEEDARATLRWLMQQRDLGEGEESHSGLRRRRTSGSRSRRKGDGDDAVIDSHGNVEEEENNQENSLSSSLTSSSTLMSGPLVGDFIDYDNLFLFGRSLGAAVSLSLASDQVLGKHIKGVILENAFLSVPDMIDVVFPIFRPFKFLCTDVWPNRERIVSLTHPLLILSSQKDELVPPSHSQSLFELAADTAFKRIIKFAEGEHMNLWLITGYYELLKEFIDNPIPLNE